MRREEAIEILAALKPELQACFGVRHIGVFGSVARDEAREDSDVDVVVDMPPVDLFTMVHLTQLLEEKLKEDVDVVRDRADLQPRLRKWISREAFYI